MKKPLARNALANVLQALMSAGLLFALYRYINTTLGVDQLGVWSVVLATASASRLADLGLGAGVIRFVARDQACGKIDRAGEVIDTATLTLMVLVGAVLPVLYPLLAKLLPYLFDAGHLSQALAILPYALVSLWLTIIASVFQDGLDGCQRMDLRAGLVVAGQALLLVLAIWLVPRHGLVGLAWAQVGQGLFLLVSGRLLLRYTLPMLPCLPRRWRKPVLREMLGYGANVQAATIFMLLLDPVAKALMASFGGAVAAGYFEMANQVVLKVRSVIVTANRAVVPHVAALTENEPNRLAPLYKENMRVLIFISLPIFALLFAWAGGISWLLVGAYRPEFVFFLGLLVVAWGCNIFSSPVYFINLGSGNVGWNTVAHIIMGALNITLGWLLGSQYGAHGVAIAYAIALIVGSGVLIIVFQKINTIGWGCWFSREHLGLVVACVAVAVVGWLIPLRPSISEPTALVAGVVLLPFVLGATVWLHPMRRQLLRWFISREGRT